MEKRKIIEPSTSDIENIISEMNRWIEKDYKFQKNELLKSEAIELFGNTGMYDKVKLLKYRKKKQSKCMRLTIISITSMDICHRVLAILNGSR